MPKPMPYPNQLVVYDSPSDSADFPIVKVGLGLGVLGFLYWLFSRRGTGGFWDGFSKAVSTPDETPLVFVLRWDGSSPSLYLKVSPTDAKGPMTAPDAIARIKKGKRSDAEIIYAGDIPQKFVEDYRNIFKEDGITLLEKA